MKLETKQRGCRGVQEWETESESASKLELSSARLQVRKRADCAYPQQIKISLKATETDACVV